jgi:MFS family permease
MDALTFLVSAAILSRIRYRKPAALEPEERSVGAAFRQYVAGLDYLRRHTGIFVMALHKAAVSLTTSGGFQVIQVALAEKVFVIGEGGAISMGIMFAVVGVGTGIGPIVMRHYTGDRERALRLAIVAGYGMAAAGVVLTATLASFGLVLAGILLRGVGGGIVWVFSTQLLLQMVPDRVRGRVFATEFALFTLASAAGAAAGGWALDFPPVGLIGALWWMAGLAAVPAILWAWWLGREGRAAPPVRKMVSD